MGKDIEKIEQEINDVNNGIEKIKSESEFLANIPQLKNIPIYFSRQEVILEKPFKVIDNDKLQHISKELKTINEKIHFMAHRDTQTTRNLFTLQMLQPASSTYRILRQCLAQIESSQTDIALSYAKLKQNFARLQRLKEKYESIPEYNYEKAELEGQIEEIQIGISNTISYLENAIKEVGYLINTYNQIKENKNIPDDWDEWDFEQEEIKSHIKSAFRNAIRDFLVHEHLGMGTTEYLEQLGISPIEASFHVKLFIKKCDEKINEIIKETNLDTEKIWDKATIDKMPDYDMFHEFLEKMAELYSESYKKACNRMGIKELYNKEYMQLSDKNK